MTQNSSTSHQKLTIENYLDPHFIHRSNWLRAAVLGANDGIISISSLAVGVATASTTKEAVLLATVAGLLAGALSMAAGEYVSVSSLHVRGQVEVWLTAQRFAPHFGQFFQLIDNNVEQVAQV